MNGFWKDTNAEGLVLAKAGQWPDATRAFEDALAQLDAEDSNVGVTPVARDDARAQLLLNLGQSHFHTGAFEDARRFAERSCAIRVGLYGENSLIVARTRGDLAVILGASGHPDEAMSLLERAVSAVEKKRGDESAHLVPLLNNATRLLARSSPALARPYVARLNALVFSQRLAENASSITRTSVPLHSFHDDAGSASDDHYLRNAIAETVDLLRTTPAANMAIADRIMKPVAASADVAFAAPPRVDAQADEIDDVHAHADEPAAITAEVLVFAVERDASADGLHTPQLLQDSLPGEVSETMALVADDTIDDNIFDLVEPPPPTLNALPQAPTAPVNPLGFEVQYGIPEQLLEPLETSATQSVVTPLAVTSLEELAQARPTRGIRAVGGVRRGSTQVVEPRRLWYIGVAIVAFGAGIGLTYIIMPLLR